MKRCDSVSVFTDWFHSAHWDHLWRNVASLRENGDEMKQHKDIIVSTKYLISNEMRVSVAKIRNFRPACPARIHFIFSPEFPACRYRHYYETNQPTQGHIVPTKDVILPTRYYCLIEKNHKFRTQKCQNFGSLAIVFMGFSRVSGFLVGINHHE